MTSTSQCATGVLSHFPLSTFPLVQGYYAVLNDASGRSRTSCCAPQTNCDQHDPGRNPPGAGRRHAGRLADAGRAGFRYPAAHRRRRHSAAESPDVHGIRITAARWRFATAIAAKLTRDNGLVYDADSEILVTTGATLGIHTALMALLDDGDEVLIPDPIYDAYQSPILLCGGRSSVRSAIVDRERTRFVLTEAMDAAADARVARAAAEHTVESGRHGVARSTELLGDW